MAKRNKKEKTPAEDAPQNPEPAATPEQPTGSMDKELASISSDPRRADVRAPKGAPEGWTPGKRRRASTAARRATRVAGNARQAVARTLDEQGVTDPDVIKAAQDAAAQKAVTNVKAAVAENDQPAQTEEKTPEQILTERQLKTKEQRLEDLPEDQRTQVEEARERTIQTTSSHRGGSVVVGGDLLARIPGVDIGDVLSQRRGQRISDLNVERLKALQSAIPTLPSNPLISGTDMAREFMRRGYTTERGKRMMHGAVPGTIDEVQKAFDVWAKTSVTNFENPDLFNRQALLAAHEDPTLLHDSVLHNIAAARRAEKTEEGAVPKKEHLNAMAIARMYNIDADKLSGMSDEAISEWNSKRRDVSGIRPDLHKELVQTHPDEIANRVADIYAEQIPQKQMEIYTNAANDKFLELSGSMFGVSTEDMVKAAHEHALDVLRNSIRAVDSDTMVRNLRKDEMGRTTVAPPVTQRIAPKQFEGMTRDAVNEALKDQGLETTPTTSKAQLEDMFYKKGRKPSGPDTRPLHAREFPELDLRGLPDDLKSAMGSDDPTVVSGAIDEITKRMQEAESMGVSVPELLGQKEKTSITGYSEGDLTRLPSKHYIQDPHTGMLTPYGITSGGLGQADIGALNKMGTVSVLPEDHPDRIHTDSSGDKHEITHVFTPDPRKVSLIPSGRGNLAIQHKITTSPRTYRMNPDLPTTVFANVEEHREHARQMMEEGRVASKKEDTGKTFEAQVPDTPEDRRRARNQALKIDEKAQGIIESDAASQLETQTALARAKAEDEGKEFDSTKFKPVVNQMSLADARHQVWTNMWNNDEIRESAKKQDPLYQQDLEEYQKAAAEMRKDPVVSGIESMKDTAFTVHARANRLADEMSYLVRKGHSAADIVSAISTSHESSPLFNDIDPEHHSLVKGLAIHRLNERHNLNIRGKTLYDVGLSQDDVSSASNSNEVFDVMRKKLPSDNPLAAAIGPAVTPVRGQIIDPALIVPSFEEWRKPKEQARATEKDLAGMNRSSLIDSPKTPMSKEEYNASIASANARSAAARQEAERLMNQPNQPTKRTTNSPIKAGGNVLPTRASLEADPSRFMEIENPALASSRTRMPQDSPELKGTIESSVGVHKSLVNSAMQSRNRMAQYSENQRKHASLINKAETLENKASSLGNSTQGKQYASEASQLRETASKHFNESGLGKTQAEHRADYESLKSQAIEHSRAEGLTARAYAQSSGHAEFFFR